MEYISDFFHFYETIDSFEAHKRQNVINPDSICFIKESSQIYTQGTLFGICKSRFESIENMVKEHEIILKNILGDEGPSVPTSTIDNLKDIIEFLSGFTTDDNLKVIVENMIETVKTEVSVITAELSQKVNSVIDTVSGLQPQIDSLRSNIAAQDSVIELINNRTDATQRTVVLLQGSFESLRTYVNGVSNDVDNRLSQMEATIRSMNSMINDINTDIMQIEEFMSDIRDDISSSATNSEEALRVATEANQKATNLVNSKGQPEGIAPINDLGKIPDNFIPEWANSVQMEESVTYFPSTGENNILYIDTATKIQYRWDGSKYDILYDPSTSADAIEALDTKTTEAIAATNTLITAESNRAKESEAILEESLDDLTTLVTSINNKIGANEGIATLDSGGKVPSAQLPSYVDDVIDVYVKEDEDDSITLYLDEELTTEVVPESGKIYISVGAVKPNAEYRWSGSTYVNIGNPIVIGTVTGTAYDGGKGSELEAKVETLNDSVDKQQTFDIIIPMSSNQDLEQKGMSIAYLGMGYLNDVELYKDGIKLSKFDILQIANDKVSAYTATIKFDNGETVRYIASVPVKCYTKYYRGIGDYPVIDIGPFGNESDLHNGLYSLQIIQGNYTSGGPSTRLVGLDILFFRLDNYNVETDNGLLQDLLKYGTSSPISCVGRIEYNSDDEQTPKKYKTVPFYINEESQTFVSELTENLNEPGNIGYYEYIPIYNGDTLTSLDLVFHKIDCDVTVTELGYPLNSDENKAKLESIIAKYFTIELEPWDMSYTGEVPEMIIHAGKLYKNVYISVSGGGVGQSDHTYYGIRGERVDYEDYNTSGTLSYIGYNRDIGETSNSSGGTITSGSESINTSINVRSTTSITVEDEFQTIEVTNTTDEKDRIIELLNFGYNKGQTIYYNNLPPISYNSTSGAYYFYYKDYDESTYPNYTEYTLKVVESAGELTFSVRKHTFNYILP